MFDVYLTVVAAIAAFALAGWVYSLIRGEVSFVDSLWSLFFPLAAIVIAVQVSGLSARGVLVLVLVSVWALRLSVYITARNWGAGEDARYQQIRANNQPGFAWKSLYIVFGLQGLLAAIVALPLLSAIPSQNGLGVLDFVAALLWFVGFLFESVGDYQLARFKRDPAQQGKVLDSGLWRYTRHPNYFGDFCVWWAFFLFALAAGGWWTIVSPLLMSFLLLRVSGVSLLEKDISSRRPAYARYVERTNAFFPGPPRNHSTS